MADKVFLKECYIHGTNQYDALDDGVWKNLKVPTTLYLRLENKKVFLVYKSKVWDTETDHKIGFLSDEDAKDIEKYIKAGWEDNLYEVKLSYKDEKKADENKRMKVVIFIKAGA